MTEKAVSQKITLPASALSLLPHRPPMLFVERLVARHGNYATALAQLPQEGICFSQGRFLKEYFIELMAQAAALANGYDAICAGEQVHDGMLVGVDSFTLHNIVTRGKAVRIETEKTFSFGAVTIIRGEVWEGEELLVSGAIKVWEDLGDDETR